MNPEEARRLITGGALALPYQIVTRGGRIYRVEDGRNVHIAPAYPDTLMIAVPRQGITLVGLGSIEAIHTEHEAVPSGPRRG